MDRKVTDLDKFALKQIFWPYQSMIGLGETAIKHLPMAINEIEDFAKKHPDWWECVINRIRKCKFYFPHYIKHTLVVFILTS